VAMLPDCFPSVEMYDVSGSKKLIAINLVLCLL
jgi:hypothetical protein